MRHNPIDSFQGEFRWLSNFYPAPMRVVDSAVLKREVVVPTSEHGYQMTKTVDPEERAAILACRTPADAKHLAKHQSKRPDWKRVQLDTMHFWVRLKFTQHPELRAKLLATQDSHLIEGNTWGDAFWGVCNGEGLNHLGIILMTVRTELWNTPRLERP